MIEVFALMGGCSNVLSAVLLLLLNEDTCTLNWILIYTRNNAASITQRFIRSESKRLKSDANESDSVTTWLLPCTFYMYIFDSSSVPTSVPVLTSLSKI